MWYHYLIGAVAAYFLFNAVMSMLSSGPSIMGVVFAVVYAYILRWAYSGITAPAPLYGGRR